MKKLGLAVVFAALSVFGLQAQNPSELIQFGVKGGVNFATLSGDDVPDGTDMRTAFYAGGMVEIPYSDRFSIQPEVMYSAQGAQQETNTYTGTLKFDYIQIPVLAKYYLAPGFSLQVGPQVGFRLNESIELDSGSLSGSSDLSYDENDVDFGVAAGLGYKFSNGFLIQARYNYGITDAVPNANARNSVIQVGVGFMF